jgi:hypothetical protein
MTILLDEAGDRQVVERGYTTIDLLPADEAGALRSDLERLKLEVSFEAPEGEGWRLKHHASFMDADQEYRRGSLLAIERYIAPRIAQIMPSMTFATGSFHVKTPGSGLVGLHRDWTLTETLGAVAYNLWCPLVDVDEDNGALRVVAGSHRVTEQLATATVKPYYSGYIDALQAMADTVPLKAGQAVVYDSRLLHWSAENRSSGIRPAVGVGCAPTGSKPVFYKPDGDQGDFLKYDMRDGGFLRHHPDDFYAGRISAPLLGRVHHENEGLDLQEFVRRVGGAGQSAPKPGATWARLKEQLSGWRSGLSAH